MTRPPRDSRPDPFAVLGLPAGAGLTDDDVRAAWRRIAAATHPDRADGGDPARFARAAAAYTDLRTASGRGEAYAALAGPDAPSLAVTAGRPRFRGLARMGIRIVTGRPVRLAVRSAAAIAAAAVGYAAAAGAPAGPAVVVGAATWLLLTGRADLGPP